ncbi:MAG: WD40 repeat domain-containing protein [Nitrospira sp.]
MTVQIVTRNMLIAVTAAVLAIGLAELASPLLFIIWERDLAMAGERPSEETKPPTWTIKHRLHHDSGVTTVAMSPNGREVSAGGILSPTISVWDVRTGAPLRVLKGLKGSTQALAYSPDGRFFAVGRGMITLADTCVFVFQAGTDTILQRLQPPPIVTRDAPKGVGMVESLQYSPDSQSLAVGFQGGAIGIYETATGRLTQAVRLSTHLQGPVVFSPHGNILVLGQWEREKGELFEHYIIQLLDVGSGEVVKTLLGHTGAITALAFTSDGKFLASGTSTGTERGSLDQKTNEMVKKRNGDPIRIWNLETGSIVRELIGHVGEVQSLVFLENERFLVSASQDRTIKIWNMAGGELVTTLTGHDGLIDSMVLSQDRRYLISGGGGSEVKIWEQHK